MKDVSSPLPKLPPSAREDENEANITVPQEISAYTSSVEFIDANASAPKDADCNLFDVAVLVDCESDDDFIRVLISSQPTSLRNKAKMDQRMENFLTL